MTTFLGRGGSDAQGSGMEAEVVRALCETKRATDSMVTTSKAIKTAIEAGNTELGNITAALASMITLLDETLTELQTSTAMAQAFATKMGEMQVEMASAKAAIDANTRGRTTP
jgi:hypothetical protein